MRSSIVVMGLLWGLLQTPCQAARPAPDPALVAQQNYQKTLGKVYVAIRLTEVTSQICGKAFADQATAQQQAYATWKQHNLPLLRDIAGRVDIAIWAQAGKDSDRYSQLVNEFNDSHAKQRQVFESTLIGLGRASFAEHCQLALNLLNGEHADLAQTYPKEIAVIQALAVKVNKPLPVVVE
jgi:hypothetical protein